MYFDFKCMFLMFKAKSHKKVLTNDVLKAEKFCNKVDDGYST